jgi:hypothetical protein
MSTDNSTPDQKDARRLDPRWKVLYLVAVTAGTLTLPQPLRAYAVAALLMLQVVLLALLAVPFRELVRMTTRLKFLFLFLIGCYLLLPAPPGDQVAEWTLPWFDWTLSLNLTGLATAVLMCGQILTVILASAVIRLSGSETDLVDGLHKLRCPRLLVYSIDNTLALLAGQPGIEKRKGSRPAGSPVAARPGYLTIVRRLVRGDAAFLIQAIQSDIDQASQRSRRIMTSADRADGRLVHDVSIVSGIALLMMSMKMLKVLPGIPLAAGHKVAILIPLYILAAQLTYSRFGATTAGMIMGLLSYLNGDGRYGIFEILKHVVPGLAIDLLWPLFRRLPRRIWLYSLLGFLAALCRLVTELVLAALLGARWEVYLFLTARVISSLSAGALGGAITYVVLPAFRPLEPAPGFPSSAEQPAPAATAADPAGTKPE